MKYKLLKDLPWAKAWEIIEVTDDYIEMNQKSFYAWWWVELEIAHLNDGTWFEPIKETPEWASNGMYVWEAKYIQHWYIYETWKISPSNSCTNTHLLKFKEKEQAQLFVNKLKALKTIWRFKTENDGEFEPDWNNDEEYKYSIAYTYCNDWKVWLKWMHDADLADQAFTPYFSSWKIAEQAIKELEVEYKLLLTN